MGNEKKDSPKAVSVEVSVAVFSLPYVPRLSIVSGASLFHGCDVPKNRCCP